MRHSVEMWLERDGDRRLAHIEMDVDMSMFPDRLVATGFKSWLSGEWVEIGLTDEEMVQAIRLIRELIQEQQAQVAIIEQYESHAHRC